VVLEVLDPLYVRDMLRDLRDATGQADGTPPTRGVVLLGYDGTYLRRVRVTPDGKLLATLG